MNENINVHDNYPSSEQSIEVPAIKVMPLKRICVTLGELPTAYIETMSYYEMLLWFIAYLRDNIIPAVNGNAEATQEVQEVVMNLQQYINNFKDSIDQDVEDLETYINNYFDNLDVQEEINNKLDDMLEDGVLEQIIEQFLQLTSLICFDNVADMKASTNLANGSYAKTLGYYSVNDGGEALYKVRTITNDDVIDEASIIALNNNNTLIAELIYNDTLNIKCFGVKGDNSTNEYTNINKALTFAKTNQLKLYFPKGEYICNDTLVVDTNHLEIFGDGKNKTIIYFNKDNATMIDLQSMYIYIHDIQFYGDWSKTQYCLKNDNSNNRSARNRFIDIKIRNFKNGISLSNYSDCNVVRGVDFHLVGNCIYIKQNDNGIIEDCTAEPFTNVFCELFQPNACAIRNCLVNTSSSSFDSQASTCFIITGTQTGGDGEHYGSCVTIENIHSEYVHQFALIGISDVSIKDVFIWNGGKTTTLNMFHYSNIGANPICNCSLNNIWIDETLYASGKYGIYKANWSESSITAPNGKTYNIAVANFNNFKVNGFNSTVNIAQELASNLYSDYEITNNKITYKNNILIIKENKWGVPSFTSSDVDSKFYLFGQSLDNNSLYIGITETFNYDVTNNAWVPYHKHSVRNLQGTSITYTPLTKNGIILLAVNGKGDTQFINLLCVIRGGTIKNATVLSSNVLTATNDGTVFTITSTSYQNPFYLCETVLNKVQ